MIDHIGFPVSDYQRAKAFYAKALAPLGYSLVMEVTQETGHDPAAGFGADGKPDFSGIGDGGFQQRGEFSLRGFAPRWDVLGRPGAVWRLVAREDLPRD